MYTKKEKQLITLVATDHSHIIGYSQTSNI